MGLSQLQSKNTGEEVSAPIQAPPQQADDQTLYGNAFMGSLLGSEPARAQSGIGDQIRDVTSRIEAREKLEGMFDLDNGASVDGRAPIDEFELEEMVDLYSDIELGKTDLKLDTAGMTEEEAAAFRSATMGDMAKIMQTESGRKLLRELAHNEKGNQTTVGRSHGIDEPKTAAVLPPKTDCSGSDAKDRPGDSVLWCADDHAHDGTGVNSQIDYRPGETTETPEGVSRSDVTLYHELAHASHNGKGDRARGGVPYALDGERQIENSEFQATGLGRWEHAVDDNGDLVPNENLYRAERRDLGDDLEKRPTYGATSPQ